MSTSDVDLSRRIARLWSNDIIYKAIILSRNSALLALRSVMQLHLHGEQVTTLECSVKDSYPCLGCSTSDAHMLMGRVTSDVQIIIGVIACECTIGVPVLLPFESLEDLPKNSRVEVLRLWLGRSGLESIGPGFEKNEDGGC